MMRDETERWALLLSAGLCTVGLGCGDMGDAQLPLPIHGRSSEPEEEFVRADVGADAAARAVVSLALTAAPAASCPPAFVALLPDASATSTLARGAGPRAFAGQHAQISCRVAQRPGSADAFDVDVRLKHPELPLLSVTGQLARASDSASGPASASSPASSQTVRLELTTPDGARIDAACPAQVHEVRTGAVWFRTRDCRFRASEAAGGACDVEVGAIFEYCPP